MLQQPRVAPRASRSCVVVRASTNRPQVRWNHMPYRDAAPHTHLNEPVATLLHGCCSLQRCNIILPLQHLPAAHSPCRSTMAPHPTPTHRPQRSRWLLLPCLLCWHVAPCLPPTWLHRHLHVLITRNASRPWSAARPCCKKRMWVLLWVSVAVGTCCGYMLWVYVGTCL